MELFWLTRPAHFLLIACFDHNVIASGRVLQNSGFEYYDSIYGDIFQPGRPALRDGLQFVLVRSWCNLFVAHLVINSALNLKWPFPQCMPSPFAIEQHKIDTYNEALMLHNQ